MFKFIHTADVHLDSPLKTLAMRDPDLAQLVGGATRRAFERVIDICIEESADALIIAGDLYDGDLRSMKTAAFLGRQMRRLDEAGIRVFMIRGNHDSESTITRYLDLPSNVHVFTGHGGVEEIPDAGVAIHGVSFARRHAPDSLLPKYRPPVDGLINIGLMHTSLAGASGHDEYAPCALNELSSHGFDYWALGHVHARQVHSEDPYVVMPGIPQGRDIGEAGPKTVTAVEISGGELSVSERNVAIAEFERVNLDLTATDCWQGMLETLRATLENARNSALSEYVICRLELSGNSNLGWRLHRDVDLLLAEAKDAADQVGGIWIEKIENKVASPVASAEDADPVDELALLMKEVAKDSAFRSEAISHLEQVVRALPAELRDRFGSDQDGTKSVLDRLLEAGATDVVASLKSGQSQKEAS